jgi:hypothetical protein
VPVVPSCLQEPAWVGFSALLGERGGGEPPQFHPGHPLGCHRRRVPGRVVFEHVVAALVHGSGYERIATPGCSDRTIRRRLAEWADLGLAEALHAAALRAYDQIIGLELGDVAVDGCQTKAPCGGGRAGPSPVDRRRGGLKRSVASDGYGIPLGLASAGANRHDSPLLAPTLQAASAQLDHLLPTDRTCHLDRGYDSQPTRQLPGQLGFDAQIARTGRPRPHPGRHPLGGRANPLVDERIRQAAPLHRAQHQGRGLLSVPRRRARHHPPADPARPHALPLGHPPDNQTAHVTVIAGAVLAGYAQPQCRRPAQRSDGPPAGLAQPRSRARQRLGIHRRGRRQRGTFGSGGCLKANHPGTWEQVRGGGEAGRGRLTPALWL